MNFATHENMNVKKPNLKKQLLFCESMHVYKKICKLFLCFWNSHMINELNLKLVQDRTIFPNLKKIKSNLKRSLSIMGPFGLNLFLLKLKTENTVAK